MEEYKTLQKSEYVPKSKSKSFLGRHGLGNASFDKLSSNSRSEYSQRRQAAASQQLSRSIDHLAKDRKAPQ